MVVSSVFDPENWLILQLRTLISFKVLKWKISFATNFASMEFLAPFRSLKSLAVLRNNLWNEFRHSGNFHFFIFIVQFWQRFRVVFGYCCLHFRKFKFLLIFSLFVHNSHFFLVPKAPSFWSCALVFSQKNSSRGLFPSVWACFENKAN